MKNATLVLLFICSFSSLCSAKSIDTLEVYTNKEGKSVLKYRVRAGQTLYSILKKFKIKKEDFQKENPSVTEKLGEGQILLIIQNIPPSKKSPTVNPIYHLVKPKETLYLISKKYGVSVKNLRLKNKLTTDELYLNQKIYLTEPEEPSKEIPVKSEEKDNNPKNNSPKEDNKKMGLSPTPFGSSFSL